MKYLIISLFVIGLLGGCSEEQGVVSDALKGAADQGVEAVKEQLPTTEPEVTVPEDVSETSIEDVLNILGEEPVGEEAAPDIETPATYTVQVGDTLSTIAKAHETTVEMLLDINVITNKNLIFPGQELSVQ